MRNVILTARITFWSILGVIAALPFVVFIVALADVALAFILAVIGILWLIEKFDSRPWRKTPAMA